MITLIEAHNFRCLRHLRTRLGPFHVLVGPNASGKTTFLEVIEFLGRLVAEGLEAAIEERTKNFEDLLWKRQGDGFELAIEASIPDDRKQMISGDKEFDTIRYQLSVGLDNESNEICIRNETVLLKNTEHGERSSAGQGNEQRLLFPESVPPFPKTILESHRGKDRRVIINKVPGGNDNFYSEVEPPSGRRWTPSIPLGPRRSAFGFLMSDESNYPVSTWLRRLLSDGIQKFVLNSLSMRMPSPPGKGKGFQPDGSNLPWVIDHLQNAAPQRFEEWLAHLRTALPDLEHIETVEKPEDKHQYLVLHHSGNTKVPSWMASDGTLRLLSLTLPAYLPETSGILLIEEPENGIHPNALETMYRSLFSVQRAQILMATHSPVLLDMADPNAVLCFVKAKDGSTIVIRGDEHPALKDWQGETKLGVLFAAGALE